MPTKIILYLFVFFKDFSLITWVLSVFYLAREFSVSEIFLLLGIYQGSILLSEIPTGYIASRFGNKNSVLFGLISQIFAISLLFFANNFYILIFVQIFLAISVAFLSGSFATFLYSFSENFGENFIKIRSDTRSISLISGLISISLGTLFLPFGFEKIFIFQLFLILISIILFFLLPSFLQKKWKNPKNFTKMLIEVKNIFVHRNIFFASFFVFSFLAIEASAFSLFQLDYIHLGFQKELLGIFLAIFTLFSLVFLQIFKIFPKLFSFRIFPIISLIFIISVSFYKILDIPILIFLLFLTQIIRPMDIFVENMIFEKISDSSASFVLSFLSFFERIFFAIFSLIIAIFGLSVNILVIVFSSILFLFSLYFLKNNSK